MLLDFLVSTFVFNRHFSEIKCEKLVKKSLRNHLEKLKKFLQLKILSAQFHCLDCFSMQLYNIDYWIPIIHISNIIPLQFVS